MMINALVVGLGGFIGSILRYAMALLIPVLPFPFATLMVNVLGSFVMGLTYAKVESGPGYLFLATGILGGFTTFSAFSMETINLMKSGEIILPLVNVAANIVLGLAFCFLGFNFSLKV